MMQQPKRRKKRPIQGGLKTVEVARGKNGYGFTISGQQPCVLSCIVSGSPADRAGLRTGDFLISVNGMNVSGAPHDDVVRLVGSSSGMLEVQISETVHSSDSSDNEMHAKPSKSKYPPHHRRNQRQHGKAIGRSMEELGVQDVRRVAEPITNKYGHVIPRRRGGAGGEESFEQINNSTGGGSGKFRSMSPGRELDQRGYGYEDARRHYHSLGVENMDPFALDPYHGRRTRHHTSGQGGGGGGPLLEGKSSRSNHHHHHRSARHTKHTIITREHRLGLAKSLGHTDTYGVLPKVPSHSQSASAAGVSGVAGHLSGHHGRDLSTSSSSSNNTYMVMNAEGRMKPQQIREKSHRQAQILQNNHSLDVQHHPQQHIDVVEGEEDFDQMGEIPGNLRVIVGYVGSVELPRDSRMNARLQSVRSAVRRLQVERKIHTMVLMVISLEGVTLVNTLGNTMAIYPSDKVAFTGVNPDDKRFFGIITFHGLIEDTGGGDVPDVISGGACHVFMVDPDLSMHNIHVNKAKNFGIQCTLNEDTQRCMEFPKSATIIVKCISRLYQDRSTSGVYENGLAHLSAFEQVNNRMFSSAAGKTDSTASSNTTDNSIRDRSSPAVPMVCVVDVPSSSGETPPTPANPNFSGPLESSGSTTLKSENSMRWPLDQSQQSFKTPGDGFDPYSMTSADKSDISHSSHHVAAAGGNVSGLSGLSVLSQDQSNTSGQQENSKLNVRAMPNPKGFPGMNQKTDSWNDLLADQNSADNLRKSMQRFLQTRNKPLESGSDIDSIKSMDSNQASPPQPSAFTSPIPPLPPRGMMRNPSGSSLGYMDQQQQQQQQQNPSINKLKTPSVNSESTFSSEELFQEQSKEMLMQMQDQVNSSSVSQPQVPTQFMPVHDAQPAKDEMPKPASSITSSASQSSQQSSKAPSTENNFLLKSKPPLPDSARTPARPNRPPIERPKSTPPIRTPGGIDRMDLEEDEYDSDPGNLSSFAVEVVGHGEIVGDGVWVGRADTLPAGIKPQQAMKQHSSSSSGGMGGFWNKTGFFRGNKKEKEKEKTPSKSIRKSGSFKQSRGFRTPKLKSQSGSSHPSRSGSIESLVVNDADIPGEKHIGGATSVTVITQNGVISYQENGTNPVGRAAGWAVNFDRLLKDRAGLAAFTEFLKKEFSEENIIFWKKCEDYKKITSLKERKAKALEIHKCHIDTDAPVPVNIDGQAKTATLQGLETAAPDLFDAPKKQIFQLMKQDSYTRFLKCEIYKDCVKSEIDCKPLPYDNVDNGQTNGHAGGPADGKRVKEERKSLKKSSSSTEEGGTEKRRRSLLPWGKKDKLAKLMPKVMTDSDLRKSSNKKDDRYNNGAGGSLGKMSLDLADLHALQKELRSIEKDVPKLNSGENGTARTGNASSSTKEVAQKFCRVIFPDGSTTVFYAKPGQSVRHVLTKLCEKRHLDVELVDVYNTQTDKIVSLHTDASQIGSKEIQLDKRVVFRVDMPNKKSLGIRGRSGRTIKQVLEPVVEKYGFKLESMLVHQVGSSEMLDVKMKVSEIEHKRIGIFPAAEIQVPTVKRKKSKEWGLGRSVAIKPLPRMASEPAKLGHSLTQDDAQNRLFQNLFDGDMDLLTQFDEDGIYDPDPGAEVSDNKSTTSSTKESSSQDNRTSVGLFSNILRKNSMDGKEGGGGGGMGGTVTSKLRRLQKGGSAKQERPVTMPPQISSMEPASSLAAKPGKDLPKEEVFSLLSKVSVQFDDQRGPLRPQDLELPDFLKPRKSGRSSTGSNIGGEFPLRRTDMHNSDTSLYEPPHSEERIKLERSRKLSNSEENLDNLSKQLRRNSRSKSSILVWGGGGGGGSNHPTANTPSGKIPYMDMSFSHDGVVPSHLEAEDYFSMSLRSASPDFTDPRSMEKSLTDIGLRDKTSSRSSSSKQFRTPIGGNSRKLQTIQQDDSTTDNSKPNTPTPAPRQRQKNHKHKVPVVPRRRNQAVRNFSDVESTSSEISDIASSTTSERNSLNSEDLNSTLLPPSVSTSDVSGDDQYSTPTHSSVQQQPHYIKHNKPYLASNGKVLSPKRPLRISPKLTHSSSSSSSVTSAKVRIGGRAGSEKLQRKQYTEQSNQQGEHHRPERWGRMFKQSSDSSMDMGSVSGSSGRGMGGSMIEDERVSLSSAEIDIIEEGNSAVNIGSIEFGTSRSTTPSPTTHDLVLFADSSPEEPRGYPEEEDDVAPYLNTTIPTPRKRNSILRKNYSLDNIVERKGESMGGSFSDGDNDKQERRKNEKRQDLDDDGVQVSFV